MRDLLVFLNFILLTLFLQAQSTESKKFTTTKNTIEIQVDGLDEVQLKNSETEEVEVLLFNEGDIPLKILTEELSEIQKIIFKPTFFNQESPVFRKYITKRLNRASVVISLPKNKNITVLGKSVDVVSESYKGNLRVFIDKGLVDLNEVGGDVELHLFQGNISAVVKTSAIHIRTNKGKILVNDEEEKSPYIKSSLNYQTNFVINSIRANVFLKDN